MSKEVDKSQSFEELSEFESPAAERLQQRRLLQRLLVWDRPPEVRASRLRPRVDARGTTTPASLRRRTRSEAAVLDWWNTQGGSPVTTPATPNTTPVDPTSLIDLDGEPRPSSAPPIPPTSAELSNLSDTSVNYRLFTATLDPPPQDIYPEDPLGEKILEQSLFLRENPVPLIAYNLLATMEQILKLDEIPEAQRVSFTIKYGTQEAPAQKTRILKVQESKKDNVEGFFELRERAVSSLVEIRNKVKTLAKLNEFRPFEKAELKSLLKSARQYQEQIKGYDTTLAESIEIESLVVLEKNHK